MNARRPPVRLTTRALTFGSLAAATLLALGLGLGVAGQSAIASLVGNVGVVVVLATPVAGLVATWWELRVMRPTRAWMAAAVLGVLVLATLVALTARA